MTYNQFTQLTIGDDINSDFENEFLLDPEVELQMEYDFLEEVEDHTDITDCNGQGCGVCDMCIYDINCEEYEENKRRKIAESCEY